MISTVRLVSASATPNTSPAATPVRVARCWPQRRSPAKQEPAGDHCDPGGGGPGREGAERLLGGPGGTRQRQRGHPRAEQHGAQHLRGSQPLAGQRHGQRQREDQAAGQQRLGEGQRDMADGPGGKKLSEARASPRTPASHRRGRRSREVISRSRRKYDFGACSAARCCRTKPTPASIAAISVIAIFTGARHLQMNRLPAHRSAPAARLDLCCPATTGTSGDVTPPLRRSGTGTRAATGQAR